MPVFVMRRAGATRLGLAQLACLWAVLVCLAGACGVAWAQAAPIPALQARITDTTQTLDAATVQSLTHALADLEQRKGAQIAVLMVPTTDNEAIESYALRAFEHWKLGRSGVDDGILLVIAKDDRRLRIEVGYGLEGAVPDLLAGRLIREQIAPRFQQGDFAGGVVAGVQGLIALVEGEDLPPPVPSSQAASDTGSWWDVLVPLAFMAMVLPPVLAVAGTGLLLFFITHSVVVAVLGAMVAFLVSLALRNRHAGPKGGSAARASRHGAGLGTAGWGAGRHGGGMGSRGGFGGGFGGGGGRSGGGGASGGW